MTNDAYPPLATLTSTQRTAADTGTLVTASDRLRREFTYAYDHARMQAGETAWHAPSITGFDALLRRDYERTRAVQSDCPTLLSPVAQHALIRAAAPIGLGHLTTLFEDAWQAMHAWGLNHRDDAFASTENTRCFATWADAVFKALERDNAITQAQLASQQFPVRESAASSELHLVGFDVLTHQQLEWLKRVTAAGVKVTRDARAVANPSGTSPTAGTLSRHSSDIAELTAAINWAKAHLEAAEADKPAPRIAIVVPNLLQQHATVTRALHALLEGSAERDEALYNVGGGLPLAEHPLVESALLLLASIHQPTHYTAFENLLVDPALPGINTHNRLPGRCSEFLLLPDLPHDVGPDPLRTIIRTTADWVGSSRVRRQINEWWAAAAALLRNARWHTARNDSEGYQATNALLDILITQAPPSSTLVSWSEAFELLNSVASQTLFAPASTPAPIQVLGYLEAIELSFDYLWITGMSATAWPTPVALNPMLPAGALAKAGAPRTTYSDELAFADSWLSRVTAQPLECHASFVVEEPADSPPETQDKSTLDGVSPLLAHWTPAPNGAAASAHPMLDYWSGQTIALHELADVKGSAPAPPALKNATRRLQDQANCPLRGWSIHTLDLDEPIAPHTLPNPLERGNALHDALQQLFTELPSAAALKALDASQTEDLCNQVAHRQIDKHFLRYAQRVQELEALRISAALAHFLAIERGRDDFFVDETEQKISGQIGPWTINLQVDRVDTIEDGLVVIDYKSTAPSAAKLIDERLTAPQIPLYVLFLLANGKPIADVDLNNPLIKAGAFAELKPDAAKYVGVRSPEAGTGLPAKLKDDQDWSLLLNRWRDQLLKLATEISTGVASATPIKGACDNCHLQSLCRYHLNYE